MITVDERRPYGDLGMTTAKWQQVPVRTVRLAELIYTQRQLFIDGIVAAARGQVSWSGDRYPHVVGWRGRLYLEDGHTRAAVAIARGHATLDARVLELDDGGQARAA